ncbi:MAG: zinc ABC transporter substrate-binding protein [Planctomycetes bacterium]|nr:zinc ABC transporter substrate-binding protein [Planctomycetota bacterium]
MKNKYLCLLVIGLLVIGLLNIWAEEKKLNVVTTTTDLKSITESIGGDFVNVKSVCQGGQDPHFIQAKPVFMTWARDADLWIRIGRELEVGYEAPILEGSRNPKIKVGETGHLDASEHILLLEVPTKQVDRSMGDVHPLGNPHYWLDPYNGRIIAKSIAERLKKLLAENAEQCRGIDKNCNAFIKKIDEAMFGAELVKEISGDKPASSADRLWELELAGKLDEFITETNTERKKQDKPSVTLGGWAGKMRAYRGSKIITYHRSLSYFANRFGLVVAEELEPKPGIPPSPNHLVAVIKKVNEEKIKALIMENYYSCKAPDLIAEKTGIKIVVITNSVGGDESAKDYVSMIDNIITKFVKSMEK